MVRLKKGRIDLDPSRKVIAFSQWTSSEKLREVTGWRDRRQLFSKALKQ